MKLLLSATFILLFWTISNAQTETALPTGKVIERISARTDSSQSYAAYLPANYTPNKKWATVFCFDPIARGKFAVERFQAAAEKYGFIVVGSNNSRNGLEAEEIQKILTVFSQDANARFSVDEKRTYAAGFSGGARLAVALALACRTCVAGVIASGAGFPSSAQPSASLSFAYFGAVGFDDFNFGEMRELESKFNESQANYRFETFDGGHEWMNQKVAADALAWLNLQAMKAGTLVADENFIEEQFTDRRAEAERLFAAKQFLDAYREYASIIRDFEKWRDVAPLKIKAGQLKNSKELKKEIESEAEIIKRQTQIAAEIVSLWTQKTDGEALNPQQDARGKLNDWRKKSDSSTDTSERRLARRLLFGLSARAIETGNFQLQEKNYALAAAQFEFARVVNPQNPFLAYELARAYALNKQKKAALDALEEAVALGFKNIERIKSDEAFANIAQETRFQKLISGIKKD
jgi:dienelactone hydrolase